MHKEADFDVHEYPNGFKLAWKRTSSNTVFSTLLINHGSLHEVPGEEGTAHFLEHMFMEGGTEKYTPQEERILRGTFGYSNAHTSRDNTNIVWGFVPEDLERSLDISAQMVFHPRLDKTVNAQQKQVVLREIAQTRSAPGFNDYNNFFWPKLARTRDHTYQNLGEEAVIEGMTEEKLRAFHARGYSPNNMVLMIAGNIPGDLVEKVGDYFGYQSRGPGQPHVFTSVTPLEERSILHVPAPGLINRENPEGSNASLLMGFVVPPQPHIDTYALAVANHLLGGSWTTGLKKRIRTDEGLAYSIGSYHSVDDNFGFIKVGGSVQAKSKERAIDLVFDELRNLRTSPAEESEIARAKKKIEYQIGSDEESINKTELAKMDYFLKGRTPPSEIIEHIKRVTAQDILRVSQQYFPADRESGKYVLLVQDPLMKKR